MSRLELEPKPKWWCPLTDAALEFAEQKHEGQKRRYTGEPYITHCMEVAALLYFQASVRPTKQMIAAAYLHDVVEDCGVTLAEIEQKFGEEISTLVYWLTDISKPTDGNRAVRKAKDRRHSAMAPAAAKTIKLADLISNSKSITKYDPNFAKVYMAEKALLLPLLKEGDAVLYAQAEKILSDYYA